MVRDLPSPATRSGSLPAMPSCTSRPSRGVASPGLEHRVRGADAGMAGERHFAARAEDADAVARLGRRGRKHEGGFGQPRPARDGLHRGVVQAVGVEHHRQRIAGAGTIGEHIELQVAAGGHAGDFRRWLRLELRAHARSPGESPFYVLRHPLRSLDRAQVRRHLGVASPSLGHHRPAGATARRRQRRARAGGGVGAVGRDQRTAGDRRWRRRQRRADRSAARTPPRIRRANWTSMPTQCSANAWPHCARWATDPRAANGRCLAGRSAGAGRTAVVDARRGLPARAGPGLRLVRRARLAATRSRCRTRTPGRSGCRCRAGANPRRIATRASPRNRRACC